MTFGITSCCKLDARKRDRKLQLAVVDVNLHRVFRGKLKNGILPSLGRILRRELRKLLAKHVPQLRRRISLAIESQRHGQVRQRRLVNLRAGQTIR